MNIVVATDGSESAIDAAKRSLDLLRPEAHVLLVMVIPEYEDPMEDAGGIEGSGISYEQAQKDWAKVNEEGRSALTRTAAVLGPNVDIRLVSDDEATGAAIVRFAHEANADVLVIGASDKGWLRRLFGGSVSDYVAHHAPCPIMMVRHNH